VSDYDGIDPAYGSFDDFDALVAATHEKRLRLLLDLVPCHTSVEHPWFRERPDLYFWADEPLNNWIASFGGPAWTRDELTGRWYLHSFFPEQPDLNWRNLEVRRRMGAVIRGWLARGADGFRIDAIDRLMKDPQLRDDPPRRVAASDRSNDVDLRFDMPSLACRGRRRYERRPLHRPPDIVKRTRFSGYFR
jgi:alpha-glucosidase